MSASLVVLLANVWMKSFEALLQEPELTENIFRSDQYKKCKTVTGEWLSEEEE